MYLLHVYYFGHVYIRHIFQADSKVERGTVTAHMAHVIGTPVTEDSENQTWLCKWLIIISMKNYIRINKDIKGKLKRATFWSIAYWQT